MALVTSNKFLDTLKTYGQAKDEDIDLAECALAMVAIDNSSVSIERYQNHIKKMIKEVAERHQLLLDEGAEDDAATQLAALKHVVADIYEYEGDSEHYDDLQNANLIRVIERRKGMPVSLALLYIHVGMAQGWQIEALNFPAHVVCRIDKGGMRLLFDPFNRCAILQAASLRELLKKLLGSQAELSSEYYEPSTKRDILIRMQNNIKLRQIEGEDYLGAIKTVEMMRLLDPDEYRLLFDVGVLYARTNQGVAAVEALEEYIDRVPAQENCQDALILLQQIKSSLH